MKKALMAFLFFFAVSNIKAQLLDNQFNLNQLLANPGAISVTIGGSFIETGSFPALPTERVDQFVTRMINEIKQKANTYPGDPQLYIKMMEKLNNYTLRDITLKRANGDVEKIDLVRYRVTGDLEDNPILKNDDVLIFQPADMNKNFFSITGAVNSPGKFHFVDGDKLSDAITLAQGINKAYENVKEVKIYRLSYNGESQDIITATVDADVQLKRGDQIVVDAAETQKKDFHVLIVGEVNRPGEIPITKNNTTIKQALNKAGGFTDNASLKRSKIYNAKSLSFILEHEYGIKLKDQLNLVDYKLDQMLVKLEGALMFRMSNVDEEDSAYFFMENELRVLVDGGPVDFSNIADSNSEAADYIVKDGDIIIVPPLEHKVYVFGQIPNPGGVPFVEGKDYNYYIKKAGGLSEYSRSSVMLIKGGTREWIPADDDKAIIEDGDYLYVPRHLSKSFSYYARSVQTYLSILGSAATIILLLINITK